MLYWKYAANQEDRFKKWTKDNTVSANLVNVCVAHRELVRVLGGRLEEHSRPLAALKGASHDFGSGVEDGHRSAGSVSDIHCAPREDTVCDLELPRARCFAGSAYQQGSVVFLLKKKSSANVSCRTQHTATAQG